MRIENRDIVAIVLCLTLIGASVAVIVLPLLDSIPFETVELGGACGIHARVEYKITDQEDWVTFWIGFSNDTFPSPDVPPVNFTTDIIIAVFQGTRSTGGYSTTIRRIALTDTKYVVYVDEKHPGPGGLTMAEEHPFHIVKISGYPQDLPVEFVYNIFTGF
jgi:hypothetical protein